MKDSITIDPQFGVNPTVTLCFWCGKDSGIALFGKLNAKQRKALNSPTGEAPRAMVLDKTPCNACLGFMEQGVILISVDEEKSKEDPQNPYRTGGWVVVSDAGIRHAIPEGELRETILLQRVAFVPDDAWDALSLPRGNEHGAHCPARNDGECFCGAVPE